MTEVSNWPGIWEVVYGAEGSITVTRDGERITPWLVVTGSETEKEGLAQ